MIAGLVLASGMSTRMGRDKLSLPFRGRTLLWHSVSSLLDPRLSAIFVVTASTASHRLPKDPRIRRIENEESRKGLSASLRKGVGALDGTSEGGEGVSALVVTLGDKPLLQAETVGLALTEFQRHEARILVARYRGRDGHPVIFDASLFDRLRSLDGDQGARCLFAENASQLRYWDTEDAGVVFDIDTSDDYATLLEMS